MGGADSEGNRMADLTGARGCRPNPAAL